MITAVARRLASRPAFWIAVGLGALYLLAIAILAPGRPLGEDLDIARTASEAADAPTLDAAWRILSEQQNEHRPILARLVFLAASPIPEPVRWNVIVVVGGLFAALMAWLLAREVKAREAPAAFLIVVAALMFNFASAEGALWAVAAVSNFGVLALTLAALAMIARGGWMAWAALAPALLAVGAQGNGVIAPFICAWWLAFNGRYLASTFWFFLAGAVTLWFLDGYVRPIGNLSFAKMDGRAGDIIIYVLTFCGSAVGFGGKALGELNIIPVTVSAAVGAIMAGVTIWGAVRGELWRGRIELWMNIFIILTGVMVAFSRLDQGPQQALASRYHVNSCLMVACTLLYLIGPRGASGPVQTAVRAAGGSLAALGLLYVAATTPILGWVHRAYAPVTSTPRPDQDPDHKWLLDRA